MESLPNRSDVYILNGIGNNSSQSILNNQFAQKKKFSEDKPCSEIVRCIRLSWGGSSFLPSNIPHHHLQTSRELLHSQPMAKSWYFQRTCCAVS